MKNTQRTQSPQRHLTQFQCRIRLNFFRWIVNRLHRSSECNCSIDSNQSNIICVLWLIVSAVMVQGGHRVACATIFQVICSNQDFKIIRALANNAMRRCNNPFLVDYWTTTEMETTDLHRTLMRCLSIFSRSSTNDSYILRRKYWKKKNRNFVMTFRDEFVNSKYSSLASRHSIAKRKRKLKLSVEFSS